MPSLPQYSEIMFGLWKIAGNDTRNFLSKRIRRYNICLLSWRAYRIVINNWLNYAHQVDRYSMQAVNSCHLKGTEKNDCKPPFVIFDIRALCCSGLSVRVPGCQKLQMAT